MNHYVLGVKLIVENTRKNRHVRGPSLRAERSNLKDCFFILRSAGFLTMTPISCASLNIAIVKKEG